MKILNLANKLTHSLKVLSASGKGIGYLLKKGASVSSTQIVQSLKSYIADVDLVIDVGANQGQFALAITDSYKKAKVYCFEPLPDLFPMLVSNTKYNDAILTYNFALGEREGEVNFFKNDHSHASSILKISGFQKDILPETSNVSMIKVGLKTLDSVAYDILEKSNGVKLLKLDVQGYEKNVLMGAKNSLRLIDYVLLEMSFVPMYENEPLFNEMNEFLNSAGFKLVAPVGYLQAPNLQIVQLDMLYKRDEDFN